MARLVIQPGTPEERAVTLRPGTNTIGRGAGNDFIINDPSVSSSHCEILLQDSTATIIDLGSTNGTFVGGEPVKEKALTPGDSIRLGNVALDFESAADSVAPSKPSAPVRIRLAGAESKSAEATEAPAPAASAGGLRVAPMFPSATGASGGDQGTPPPLAPHVVNGPLYCKFHPRSRAVYWCHQCAKAFCELCVSTRRDRDTVHHVCRKCSSECAPVEADFTPPAPRSFFSRILGAFKYPINGDGLILLITGTIFFAAIDFAKVISRYAGLFGLAALIILTLFGTGYLFSYVRRIITASAQGEDRMPDWPDFSDWGTDIMAPFFQLLSIFTVCFGPTLILLIFYGDQTWGPLAAIIAGLFGVVYFPMALLAVAMFDSVGAMNPLLVLPSIIRVPVHYVAIMLLSLCVGGMQVVVGILLSIIIPIKFFPDVIGNFASLYFLIVNMRVLGLLYYTNRRKLGWFRR